MIRRVAIETHGDDPTPYGRDSFAQNLSTLDADDEARRNLADLCEFSRKFGVTYLLKGRPRNLKTELLDILKYDPRAS